MREQIKGKQIEYDRGTNGVIFWLWNGKQYEVANEQLVEYLRKTAEYANHDMVRVLKNDLNNLEVMIDIPSWAPHSSQCIQEIKPQKTSPRVYCFNTKTGLLNALGNTEEYRLESDWQEVGAIKLPFHLTNYQNGKIAYEIQLDHAELNQKIPNNQFNMPSIPQLSCVKG